MRRCPAKAPHNMATASILSVATLYILLLISRPPYLKPIRDWLPRSTPLTLCSYQINYDAILDLTSVQVRQQLDINLDDLACRWRLDRARGTFPQSWKLAENLISSGVPGILAQSFAPDATTHNINLILWV